MLPGAAAATEPYVRRAENYTYHAVPPSAEDLFALFRLCGGSEPDVVEFLAKLWGTTPLVICDVVRSWLKDMPAVPLPSRSRSAPPVLPKAISQRLASAAPAATASVVAKPLLSWERAAAVRRAARGHPLQPIQPSGPVVSGARLPAASAPVRGSATSLGGFDRSAALSGLHAANSRLHAHLHAEHAATRGGEASLGWPAAAGRSTDVLTLPQQPSFSPVVFTAAQVATVPEDATLDFMAGGEGAADHDALRAFMDRTAVLRTKFTVADAARGTDYGSHRMRF